jgi:hypothetical protein
MDNPIYGAQFHGSGAENHNDVERMHRQIEALGGVLHFEIHKDSDGWSALCEEVAGIVTGGSNPYPEDWEIEDGIRDAIYTAFHVRTKPVPTLLKTEVTQLGLSFA